MSNTTYRTDCRLDTQYGFCHIPTHKKQFLIPYPCTIAVMAHGLGSIYPPEHVELAGQIAQSGAVISELEMRRLVRRLEGTRYARGRTV